jgi:CubicO group peptidase (beta-lactamase class C family)
MREAEAFLTRRSISATLLSVGALASCGRQDGSSADASASEAPEPAPLTQDRLESLRASGGLPALAAAAQSRSGAISLATGYRMRGGLKLATTQDQWHLGSIAKSMTATLVARCVEAGLISWDDKIGDVLGPVVGDMRESYRETTYLHLLSHRGGMQRDVWQAAAVAIPMHERDARDTRRFLAKRILRQVPQAAPGAEFFYSNSHYLVAGAMLEAQLGQPWERLMRAFVFRPLGMYQSGFGPPYTGPRDSGDVRAPTGHASWVTNSVTPVPMRDVPVAWGPAGRVHATMQDALLYLRAHRDRSASFLTRRSWAKLHTPPFGGTYALGWHIRHGGLWHNGHNTMWYAEALIRRDACSIAVSNDGRQQIARPLVHAALMDAARTTTL